MINISRVITGLVFVFSGLIKANDPIGFGYKLQEYFHVLGLSFLNDFAVFIAIAVCALEILLGGLLLLGFWRKAVAWGLLLLIVFFTFLTFYSAFFEVVTSCGCFGDAIPLTPWQSFIKDLVLLVLILVIFKNYGKIKPVLTDFYTKCILTVALTILSVGIGIYTYNYLPFVDFLPYKKGSHIPSLMVMPEGEEGDVFETTYEMKNSESGEEKSISDREYIDQEIWKDTTWVIIGEPKSRLIKKGYTIPVTDLLISDADGADVTQEIISNPYRSVVIVAWDLKNIHVDALKKINATLRQVVEDYPTTRTILLTASSNRDAEALSDDVGLLAEVFYADAVPLKSMVRANPGVMFLENGAILDKWHYNTFPKFEKLNRQFFDQE